MYNSAEELVSTSPTEKFLPFWLLRWKGLEGGRRGQGAKENWTYEVKLVSHSIFSVKNQHRDHELCIKDCLKKVAFNKV